MINTRWIPYHKEYWFRNKFQQNFLRLHSSMAEIVYNPLDLWNGMRKIFKFYWSWEETKSDKWQTQTRSGPKFEPSHFAINQNIANGTIHNCRTVMLRKPIFCVCDNHMVPAVPSPMIVMLSGSLAINILLPSVVPL